jgi:hypothetical protein
MGRSNLALSSFAWANQLCHGDDLDNENVQYNDNNTNNNTSLLKEKSRYASCTLQVISTTWVTRHTCDLLLTGDSIGYLGRWERVSTLVCIRENDNHWYTQMIPWRRSWAIEVFDISRTRTDSIVQHSSFKSYQRSNQNFVSSDLEAFTRNSNSWCHTVGTRVAEQAWLTIIRESGSSEL